MTQQHRPLHRAFAGLCALLLAACASAGFEAAAPLANPGFEPQKCDEGTLCDWTTEGQIASVPTWHEEDHGTELLGAPVSLSQLLDPFPGGACVRFELVADVAAAADVSIALDFDDDGTVEYRDPIPAAHWTLLTYQHQAPPSAASLRVRIDKRAQGHAVLARLALMAVDCDAQP